MLYEVKRDFGDSAFDFLRVVLPKLKEKRMLSGKIIPVESVTAKEMVKHLDIDGGIDVWQIQKGVGMRGIASRIQWGNKNWNTFTIRKSRTSGAKTEYEKRMFAIKTGGYLYPFYTIQAYVSQRRVGDLISVAIAKTKDIFDLIKVGLCYEKPNGSDGNVFIIVDWEDMFVNNKAIKAWDNTYNELYWEDFKIFQKSAVP